MAKLENYQHSTVLLDLFITRTTFVALFSFVSLNIPFHKEMMILAGHCYVCNSIIVWHLAEKYTAGSCFRDYISVCFKLTKFVLNLI